MDTGSTVSRLIEYLESKGASSVSVATFLDKPSRRKVQFKLLGKGKFYRGFEVCSSFNLSYVFFVLLACSGCFVDGKFIYDCALLLIISTNRLNKGIALLMNCGV